LQFVDVQLQGEVGDMSVGIYGDWAHAKGRTSAAGTGNFYGRTAAFAVGAVANTVGNKYDAFSIRATLEPISRIVLLAGYGYQKVTQAGAVSDGTIKQFQLGANYALYQNMELSVVYNNNKTTKITNVGTTTRTTTFQVEALM